MSTYRRLLDTKPRPVLTVALSEKTARLAEVAGGLREGRVGRVRAGCVPPGSWHVLYLLRAFFRIPAFCLGPIGFRVP